MHRWYLAHFEKVLADKKTTPEMRKEILPILPMVFNKSFSDYYCSHQL